MAEEWLTTEQAAELSGYHPDHIRRLIRGGDLQARGVPGRRLPDVIRIVSPAATPEGDRIRGSEPRSDVRWRGRC